MPKKFLPVVNQEANEILISGPIGKSFWSDEGISGKEFQDALNKFPKGTKVTIGVNSQGGSVGEGLEIYNAIQRRSGDVTVRIDGYALSIASVFPLAAHKVVSPESSVWMIHNAWGWSEGNAQDMRDYAEVLDTHDEVIVNAYIKRTKKTRAEIEKAMADETWMTGKEAIEFGLADEIGTNATALDALDFSNAPRALADRMRLQFAACAIAASLKFTAPQGGAKTKTETQGPTMKREEIIALLKEKGVKVADDATDEWLKAELKKALAAAPSPHAGDKKDDPTSALALELKALREKSEKQHRNSVALEIDKLILEDKVTVAERDTEIRLCMEDEDRIKNILSKRQPVPVAEPVKGGIQYGDEGGRDVVMAKPQEKRVRFNYMRDNFASLRLHYRSASYRRSSPQAANTTDAQLVTDMLTEGVTTVLQNRLAPLRAFTIEVSADPVKPLAVLQHRKITAGGTVQTNPTNFEDTTNFVGTEVNVPITMAQLVAGGHVTNAERNSGVKLSQWIEKKLSEIGDAIMGAVAATILEGTFNTHTPIVSAAAAFGDAELKDAWGKLKKAAIKSITLDGEYFARFLPTSTEDFTIEQFRFRGWDNFSLNTVWTGATANTVGFANHPQAIVYGIGEPLVEDKARNTRSISNVTLPGIGVVVQTNEWQSNITRAEWITYDVMFGAAANDTTAGVLIKSS